MRLWRCKWAGGSSRKLGEIATGRDGVLPGLPRVNGRKTDQQRGTG